MIEILAPAGNMESLIAAVRCGCGAVYLGGKSLNARRGAENFDRAQLREAVSYCHTRGVNVYLTLNTVVFDGELGLVERAVEEAADAGVDALIVQDMAVAALAKACAPGIALHASTQMSVYSLEGVELLRALGFSRVVLARELSLSEIRHIAENSDIGIECFVHGALCMCVSGQCYLSSMIGGRSGNRGLCAQPCRLPFSAGDGDDTALSLRDLSVISSIQQLASANVAALKIEGRLKRPEYVAAAVTACRKQMVGIEPDYEGLRAVFSRGGFTDGYLQGKLDREMFGTRRKEDVTATALILKKLAWLYKNERQNVPVQFAFEMREGKNSVLTVADSEGGHARIVGDVPEKAVTSPTNENKIIAALQKTGGTPYIVKDISIEIDEGLMLPASALNSMRRLALDELSDIRGANVQKFAPAPASLTRIEPPKASEKTPSLRVRVADISQLGNGLAEAAEYIIIPAAQADRLEDSFISRYGDKIIVEIPRVIFGSSPEIDNALDLAHERGVSHAMAGSADGITRAKRYNFTIHGDFSLNITNSVAASRYASMGLSDITYSFENQLSGIKRMNTDIPRGILAYGFLPLMVTRNAPLGIDGDGGVLSDRLGNHFQVRRSGDIWELYNCTPLYLADKLDEMRGLDFLTLYFTTENAAQCADILEKYRRGDKTDESKTRGLYFRKVL